jgi:hypothetical protein
MSARLAAAFLRSTCGAVLGLAFACGGGEADEGACGPVPAPAFVHGERSCGGTGFTVARASLGDVEVMAPPQDLEQPFSFSMTGWRPASHGVTLEFALDGRSDSPRFVVRGPAATMQGVSGVISKADGGELVDEATADAEGNLEFALTEFGLGYGYVLVLDGWPASSCDELVIDLPC